MPSLQAVDWMDNAQPASPAGTNFVIVQAEMVTNQFQAYAQAEPVALLPLRAAQSGVVARLDATPGNRVRAGEKVAELGGPEIDAALAQDEAGVESARTNLVAARAVLAIEQQQLASHIATHLMVFQAESAVAQSRSALQTARARLRALQAAMTLKATGDGTVLAVSAAEGQRVAAGDTILTIQPADKLWLKAAFYGTDRMAVHAGMTGQFYPAGGGPPISVKVSTVFGALTPDGGEGVGLFSTAPSPDWMSGQAGMVVLNGTARKMAAIPTEALILDRGQWWVLVHSAGGNQPRLVTPGPSRGWQTFIEQGLQPGEKVVVENAYLEFHRNTAHTFQAAD